MFLKKVSTVERSPDCIQLVRVTSSTFSNNWANNLLCTSCLHQPEFPAFTPHPFFSFLRCFFILRLSMQKEMWNSPKVHHIWKIWFPLRLCLNSETCFIIKNPYNLKLPHGLLVHEQVGWEVDVSPGCSRIGNRLRRHVGAHDMWSWYCLMVSDENEIIERQNNSHMLVRGKK